MNKSHWKKKRIFPKFSGWPASAAIWRKTPPFGNSIATSSHAVKCLRAAAEAAYQAHLLFTRYSKIRLENTGGGCAAKTE
jgi:hypothetical protein